MWQNAATFASGWRVSKPYGDRLILNIVRESGGLALARFDRQIFELLKDWAANEGILLSPEGAAATAAYDALIQSGFSKAIGQGGSLQHRLRQQIHRPSR